MALLALLALHDGRALESSMIDRVTALASLGARTEPVLGAVARECVRVTLRAAYCGLCGVQTVLCADGGLVRRNYHAVRRYGRIPDVCALRVRSMGRLGLHQDRCSARRNQRGRPEPVSPSAPELHGHLVLSVASRRKRCVSRSELTCSHSAPSSGLPPGSSRTPNT